MNQETLTKAEKLKDAIMTIELDLESVDLEIKEAWPILEPGTIATLAKIIQNELTARLAKLKGELEAL